jgi:hypothetical protein
MISRGVCRFLFSFVMILFYFVYFCLILFCFFNFVFFVYFCMLLFGFFVFLNIVFFINCVCFCLILYALLYLDDLA